MRGPWSSVPEQRAALMRAASASGCRVIAGAPRQTSVGEYYAATLQCPDGWSGAKLLSVLTEEDSQTAGARDAALELRRGARSDRDFVRAVFDEAKSLRFDREPGETFAMGSYTRDAGGGDCDDHARFTTALLKAGGVPARIAYLHKPGARPVSAKFAQPGEDPSHAVAQVMLDGQWRWLESTLDANLGEEPVSAARRLGLLRGDLALAASTIEPHTLQPYPIMGALSATVVSSANSADVTSSYLRAVAELARRLRLRGADLTGEDLLAVQYGESGVKPSSYGPDKNHDGKPDNQDGLWDYGLIGIHGPAGLRSVGWSGTPEAFLALTAEQQLPYVERFYMKAVLPEQWPYVHGARSLYAINAWPGYWAQRPSAFLADDYVIARAGKGAYYSDFDWDKKGYNVPTDIDRWIANVATGPRWNEIRDRYWAESGEVENRDLSPLGFFKGSLFVAGCAIATGLLVKSA
jgi:hypothetical protein